MGDLGILIPLAPFIMVVLIVVVPAWLKSRERKEMQETLRSAIEKGQPLPPEVIEALSRDNIKVPATAAKDIRVGMILLSVGIGIALMGYFIGLIQDRATYPMIGMAMVPTMIGVAFVILSFFNKNKD